MAEFKWSDQQQAIFDWFRSGSGNLIVRARAGCGKTTTCEHGIRIAPEATVLYAVFNKKNQVEATEKMKGRDGLTVRTWNSVGFQLCLRRWRGVRPNDKAEKVRVEQACGGANRAPRGFVAAAAKLVGLLKNCRPHCRSVQEALDIADQYRVYPDEASRDGQWNEDRMAEVAVQVLRHREPVNGEISYNDQVWLPVVLDLARPTYGLVVVDEAQDTNPVCLELAMRLRAGRVCVVGDDHQAIYGFRGADVNALDRLKVELQAVELALTETRRCPKAVVEEARVFVPDFVATPEAPEGEVADADHTQMLDQAREGDFILSRTNAPMVRVCMALLRAGRPARIEGRDVGDQLVGVVEQLVGWSEEKQRRYGKGRPVKPRCEDIQPFLDKLARWATKEVQKAQVKEDERREQFIRDQEQVLEALSEGLERVSQLEARIRELFVDSDNRPRPAVVCSTVHKAKGLEAPTVWLLERTFRHQAATMPDGDHAPAPQANEEDNIRYVAITRSKNRLFFVEGDLAA